MRKYFKSMGTVNNFDLWNCEINKPTVIYQHLTCLWIFSKLVPIRNSDYAATAAKTLEPLKTAAETFK